MPLWVIHGVVSGLRDLIPTGPQKRTCLVRILNFINVPFGSSSHCTFADITQPALLSTLIALVVEVPLCIYMSLWAAHPFATYLAGSDVVADITAHMWWTIDWVSIHSNTSGQIA